MTGGALHMVACSRLFSRTRSGGRKTMLQIFIDLSAMRDGLLEIGGEEYNHIRNALRMKPGEQLLARGRDGDGDAALFEIVSFTEDRVICRLLSMQRPEVELPVRVILFQGLPKSDKMDFIVQKAVETGAARIVPVEMHRSIVKLAGDKRRKRVARWQAIAEAAAKQSRRAMIPEVGEILSMEEALRSASETADVIFVPYEGLASGDRTGTRSMLEDLQPGQTVAVFIGPEGGFEDSEIEKAVAQGARTISLGRRILRTETAALAFLSFLTYRFEL